jgi:RNA polymerase sigma factor (sigma-70 family)
MECGEQFSQYLFGFGPGRRFNIEVQMTDDQKLLAEYVDNGSEEAFRELVTRYFDFVYSSAVRLVQGDRQLAEDVAQMVFTDLARKACSLSREVLIGGWLHQRTFNVARTVLRGERRRQAREREAVAMNALRNNSDGELVQLTEVLDAAILQLGREDRKAILLRFFEQRNFRAVGEGIGTSEDGARMRVARAVEKLHIVLKRRGVTLSAAALGTALGTQAVAAAPAGLAASVATTALASAGTGTAAVLTYLKLMVTTKVKVGITGAILVAGLVSLLLHRQSQARLGERDESLRQQARVLAQLVAENQRLSTLTNQASASVEDPQWNDLLRLRAEAESLRGQVREIPALQEENRRLQRRLSREAQTPFQIQEQLWAKTRWVEAWMRAFIAYARENQGRLPASFEQAEPFLPREVREETAVTGDQFEILYHGSLDSLTNRESIVFREKSLWPHETGKWGRIYGMADCRSGIFDGRAQYCSSSDKTANGNCDSFEKEYMVTATGNE